MSSPPMASQLHVGIVNDHHDIVPFLHALLRRKLIKRGLMMIHFDSHADLCVPSTNARVESFLHPRKLYYDVLGDSEAAESEFLLPLMYAGDVGAVVWVRSEWAGACSIPDGHYSFRVGNAVRDDEAQALAAASAATTARLRGTGAGAGAGAGADPAGGRSSAAPRCYAVAELPLPYYLDEGSAVASGALDCPTCSSSTGNHGNRRDGECGKECREVQARRVCFSVCERSALVGHLTPPLPITSSQGAIAQQEQEQRPWVLDVCLDYFSVISPFLPSIRCALGRDLATYHRRHGRGRGVGAGAGAGMDISLPPASAEEAVSMLQTMYAHLRYRQVSRATAAAATATAVVGNNDDKSDGEAAAAAAAAPIASSTGLSAPSRRDALSALNNLLRTWRPKDSCSDSDVDKECEALFMALFEAEGAGWGSAIAVRRRVLPILSPATRELLVAAGQCLCLPHHPCDGEEIAAHLEAFKATLEAIAAAGGTVNGNDDDGDDGGGGGGSSGHNVGMGVSIRTPCICIAPMPCAVTIARSVDDRALDGARIPYASAAAGGGGSHYPPSGGTGVCNNPPGGGGGAGINGKRDGEEDEDGSGTPAKRARTDHAANSEEAEEAEEAEEDGFTPAAQVQLLEEGVMHVMRSLLGPDGAWRAACGRVGLPVPSLQEHVLYGQGREDDAYERCYGLFLPKSAKNLKLL